MNVLSVSSPTFAHTELFVFVLSTSVSGLTKLFTPNVLKPVKSQCNQNRNNLYPVAMSLFMLAVKV